MDPHAYRHRFPGSAREWFVDEAMELAEFREAMGITAAEWEAALVLAEARARDRGRGGPMLNSALSRYMRRHAAGILYRNRYTDAGNRARREQLRAEYAAAKAAFELPIAPAEPAGRLTKPARSAAPALAAPAERADA